MTVITVDSVTSAISFSGVPNYAYTIAGGILFSLLFAMFIASGGPIQDVEIPDDVLAAAVKVEAWLKTMPDTMVLHGLQLVEE